MLGIKKGWWSIAAVVLSVTFLLTSALWAGCAKPAAPAEEFPNRPVFIIVPWSPSGRTDLAVRGWAPFFEKELGVPVVVANKPGGGGVIGAAAVINGAADGYRIIPLSDSHVMAQFTKEPPFSYAELEPICKLTTQPLTMTVDADSPWNTVAEVVEYVKAHPGEVKHGASAAGTNDHTSSAWFWDDMGGEVKFVHYKGEAGPRALAAGEVDVSMSPPIAVKPLVDAGELKILGVTLTERSPLYPDIPTFREQGIDWTRVYSDGIFVKKGTPPEIVSILSEALKNTLTSQEVVDQLATIYIESTWAPAAEHQKYLDTVSPRLQEIGKQLGLIK